jgi:hypothetical protein
VIGGGKSGLKERLLGSTTSRVATQIKRPNINSEVSCKKKAIQTILSNPCCHYNYLEFIVRNANLKDVLLHFCV